MVDIPKSGVIFYLIHFDDFIESRGPLFSLNSEDSLKTTGEYAFVERVNRYVSYATRNGLLICIRSKRTPNAVEKASLTADYLPCDAKRDSVFLIYDDLFRTPEWEIKEGASPSFNAFDAAMGELESVYNKKTGMKLQNAKHIFAGYNSDDCVPSIVQALVEGTGFSFPSAPWDDIFKIEYTHGKIACNNCYVVSDCIWPLRKYIIFGSERGMKSDASHKIEAMSLESILRLIDPAN